MKNLFVGVRNTTIFARLIQIGCFAAVLNVFGAPTAYKLETIWGGSGEGPGRFREPMGIDIGLDGAVYVADSRNRRIQKFDSTGKYLMEITGPKGQPGRLEKPVDVAVSSGGTLYVCDFEADRILVYSSDGGFLFDWGGGGKGPGQFDAPSGLEVDSKGRLYVADFYNHRVQVFSAKGEWKRTLGKEGHASGELYYPTDAAMDPEGSVLIADAYNHRIQRFTPEGRIAKGWGFRWTRFHPIANALHVPTGLVLDGKNRVHVADSGNKRVVLLDGEGSYLGEWKMQADRSPKVYSPTRIAVTRGGKVIAVDTGNDRLLVLSVSGD